MVRPTAPAPATPLLTGPTLSAPSSRSRARGAAVKARRGDPRGEPAACSRHTLPAHPRTDQKQEPAPLPQKVCVLSSSEQRHRLDTAHSATGARRSPGPAPSLGMASPSKHKETKTHAHAHAHTRPCKHTRTQHSSGSTSQHSPGSHGHGAGRAEAHSFTHWAAAGGRGAAEDTKPLTSMTTRSPALPGAAAAGAGSSGGGSLPSRGFPTALPCEHGSPSFALPPPPAAPRSGHAAPRAPLPHPCAPLLSLAHRQLFSSCRTHAQTHSDTRASRAGVHPRRRHFT